MTKSSKSPMRFGGPTEVPHLLPKQLSWPLPRCHLQSLRLSQSNQHRLLPLVVVVVVSVAGANPGAVEEVVEVPTTIQQLQIKLKLRHNKIKIKNLTRRAQRPHQTFPTTPVPATGRTGKPRLTARTPWCAAGSTSSPPGPEKLGNLVLK